MAPETTPSTNVATGQKRNAPSSGSAANAAGFRPVKRRASKACQCCRARKVRCNVVEHGAPCTNCRLDEVECIITESKRRKKNWGLKLDSATTGEAPKDPVAPTAVSPQRQRLPSFSHDHILSASPTTLSNDGHSDKENGTHVPHLIYQTQNLRRASFASSHGSLPSLNNSLSTQSSTTSSFPRRLSTSIPTLELPAFIKPSPARIPAEDMDYLWRKGALSLPAEPLRSELLKAHFDFVHPFMPLINRKEFLDIVSAEDGRNGKVGLLIFQAVMFSGSAFVDIEALKAAGYPSRKIARKAFYTKTRLLYDFDHEQDRMILVQALLLMTFWYETPDDQKDTWHWMGVAISLSHTIGLHRNPEKSNMEPKRQKLWKRIWWSCFMRDRLVALGMRRPTRIKDADADVPMLTPEDFDIDVGLDENELMFCTYEERRKKETEVARQRELALMCIEKAKLCVCISRVLGVQYSVLNTNHGSTTSDGSTRTTMMLLPKKLDPGCAEVRGCDEELDKWKNDLPVEAIYRTPGGGEVDPVLALHRNLLHMIYYTTVSALHRPQVLPSSPTVWPNRQSTNVESQEVSRKKVRQAASEITRLAEELIEYNLVRYLPTAGVTVILPAVIIHLLDMKSANPVSREMSLEGFGICMEVLQGLRQLYNAADYATHFLEAAIRKAGMQLTGLRKHAKKRLARYRAGRTNQTSTTDTNMPPAFGTAISMPATAPPSNAALTPPPDIDSLNIDPKSGTLDESDLQLKLESFLQAPPSPQHEGQVSMDIDNSLQTNTLFDQNSTAPQALAIPASSDDSLDMLFAGQNSDPFLGHYDDCAPLTIPNRKEAKTVDWSSQWRENNVDDIPKILDGVEFDFDDVIQFLETEIN